MFLFKKLVDSLLLPHTIFLGLLGVGVLLLWFSSKRRLARILVTMAAAGLILLSYPVAWDGVIGHMESRYPPLDLLQTDLGGVRWIVVLGGGGTMDDGLPATSQLSSPSQARLMEGIRVLRSVPHAKLLLSGDSEAGIMHDAVRLFGIDADQIVIEGNSWDTEQQAEEIKNLVGHDRFILVTSALHMSRAMALFRQQGLAPIAAPADFLVKRDASRTSNPATMILPESNGGPYTDALFHEWLGMLWEKLRGRI